MTKAQKSARARQLYDAIYLRLAATWDSSSLLAQIAQLRDLATGDFNEKTQTVAIVPISIVVRGVYKRRKQRKSRARLSGK